MPSFYQLSYTAEEVDYLLSQISSQVGGNSGVTIASTVDNVDYNVVFTDETSGTQENAYINTSKLYFNPSTGVLTATAFSGDGSNLTGVATEFNIDGGSAFTVYTSDQIFDGGNA